MIKPILFIVLLFLLPLTYSQLINIDESPRQLQLTKGGEVPFIVKDSSFSLILGDIDLIHNRVTIQLNPELGTKVVSLNEKVEIDVDDDNSRDLLITLNQVTNEGIGKNGIPGTASILLEKHTDAINSELVQEETKLETTTTQKQGIDQVTGQAVQEELDPGYGVNETLFDNFDFNYLYLILFVLVIGLLLVFRKPIMNLFKGDNSKSNKQQTTITSKMTSQEVCSKCNKPVKSDDKFCPSCGNKIEHTSVNFCKNCGSRLESGANFCQKCGGRAK